MKRHGYRGRLGGVLLAVALGALAMLALPAIGIGKHGSDHHGPRPAGTISSFDKETGVLTVALAKGGEISAMVVRRTHIRCGESRRRHLRRGGSDDQTVDDRGGRGAEEPGEDRGDRGHEPGEGNHVQGDGPQQGHHGHRGRHGCNAGDLVEGATVIKAEIVLTHGKALFKKIGLLPPQAVEPGPEEPETP